MALKFSLPVHEEPCIINLLSRMPSYVKESFTEEQLVYLLNAVVNRQWDIHKIDFRTTFGLFKWRFYLVVLAGHNLRTLTRGQQKRQLLINSIMLSCFLVMCMF
jgi:hypothetical protein